MLPRKARLWGEAELEGAATWLVEFCCRQCVLMLLVAEQRDCYLQRASSGLEQRESKGGEGEEGESGGVTNDVREDVIWPPTHA